MTLRPEQIRATEYLRDRGTRQRAAEIRDRVAAAFAAFDDVIAAVEAPAARRRPAAESWSVHEMVDHLVESHRAALGELRDLLAGRRPAGPPVPAGLQSSDPMGRSWADLRADLRAIHGEVLDELAAAGDDIPLEARAPAVMVINAADPDGVERPLHWIEELDWKAYAIVFRLHEMDHLGQIRRALHAGGTARAARTA